MKIKDRTIPFVSILGIALSIGVVTAFSKSSTYNLLGDFPVGWNNEWKEKTFIMSSNHFEVVEEAGNHVLKVESNKSASGLWRKFKIDPLESGKISWRWKVDKSLIDNTYEIEKKGDDYAARVVVVFERGFLPWKIKAICYVWAGSEPVGNIYSSPYASNVAMIVLQSGDEHVDRWISEERDIVADYRQYFGKSPKKVSAFAVMVDTDQTGARATAWFDDLVLEL